MDMTNTAAAEPLGWQGRIGDFIALAIGNLLLTIVTLGIYRFWAKTRNRRHLWARTSFRGEPLEYRGRGIEKFVGALIVFAVVFVPFFVVSLVAAALMGRGDIANVIVLYVALYLGLIYLLGVGIYRSQRYIFSRTAWRGIRGGMRHGGWRYGLLFLSMLLLQLLTLGFASPYMATRLWNAKMNDAVFGTAEVAATADWRSVYGRFIVAWIGAIIVYAVTLFVMFGLFGSELAALAPGAPPPADPTAVLATVAKLYGLFIVVALVIALLMIGYHAALMRELFGKTRIGTLGLRFDAHASECRATDSPTPSTFRPSSLRCARRSTMV